MELSDSDYSGSDYDVDGVIFNTRTRFDPELIHTASVLGYLDDDLDLLLAIHEMEREELRYARHHHFNQRIMFDINATVQPSLQLFRFTIEDIGNLSRLFRFAEEVQLANRVKLSGIKC